MPFTEEHALQLAEIHAKIVDGTQTDSRLRKVARSVVDARHYMGDDGWDKLKNAICELEGIVGGPNEG